MSLFAFTIFLATNIWKITGTTKIFKKFLLFFLTQLLYVDGALFLETFQDRRLIVLLTSAKLPYNACPFKLSLEFFKSSFDVLTILNWYNNHVVLVLIFKCKT